MKKILIIGSLNMDTVISTSHLPKPGETIHGTPSGQAFIPAKKVKAVDTTAAGDAFIAGFAVSLSRGKSVMESIEYGQAVAGTAISRPGAQDSIPMAEEVIF